MVLILPNIDSRSHVGNSVFRGKRVEFEVVSSFYIYRGSLSRTILDKDCMRAYHQKWLGYARCDLPAHCGAVFQHDIATTWYGSRIHLCVGNSSWQHHENVELRYYEPRVVNPTFSIPEHLAWATLLIDDKRHYAFVPKTYDVHDLKLQQEKMVYTADWTSLCIYESREDVLVRFLVDEAEKDDNVISPWVLRDSAFIPNRFIPKHCSFQCTPLPYNTSHAFCSESLGSPYKFTACSTVFNLKPILGKHLTMPHICMPLHVSETDVVSHYFSSLDIRSLVITMIETFLTETFNVLLRVFDEVYPSFERLVMHICTHLRPKLEALMRYIRSLDVDYYVLEYFLLVLTVTYRANFPAALLLLILVLNIIGPERHYPSILDVLEQD